MKVTAKKLVIRNFKGTQIASYEFDESDNVFKGKNGSGKSTMYEAFIWLLEDKDVQGKSNNLFKPYDENKKVINYLDSEVEATIEINGKTTTILKVSTEIWGKERGSVEKVLKRNESSYYINEIPYTPTNYKKFIEETFGENIRHLTVSGSVMATVKMEDRRNIITSIVPSISDIEIAKDLAVKDERFDYVVKLLGDVDVSDEISKLNSQIKKLKKDIEDIPVKINSNLEVMPEQVDETTVNKSIAKRESKLQKIEEEENSLRKKYKSQRKEYKRKQDSISMINTKIYSLKKQIEKESSKENEKLEAKIDDLKKIKTELEREDKNRAIEIEKLADDTKRKKAVLRELRTEYTAINKEVFIADEEKPCCPTCKRAYDDPESIESELREQFNISKTSRLQANIKLGKSTKEIIDKNTSDIEKLKSISNESKIKLLTEELESIVISPVTPNKEINDLKLQIAAIEKELEETKEGGTEIDNQEEKKKLRAEIIELKVSIASNNTRNNLKKRNQELRDELIQKNQEALKLESGLDVITYFTKEKMIRAESQVNSKFDHVEFKLWDYYQNGNDNPVCDCYMGGVPYNSLNTAKKIKADLDIIKALSNHRDIYMPVFIDNRESVTEIQPMDNQIISLVVDPEFNEVTKVN